MDRPPPSGSRTPKFLTPKQSLVQFGEEIKTGGWLLEVAVIDVCHLPARPVAPEVGSKHLSQVCPSFWVLLRVRAPLTQTAGANGLRGTRESLLPASRD